MPNKSNRHYLSILKSVLKNDIFQVSAMCLLIVILSISIINIIKNMIIVAPSSSMIVLQEDFFEEELVIDSVTDENIFIDRYVLCQAYFEEFEEDDIDVSNSYKREIITQEYEIAPIIVVVDIQEEQYLAPATAVETKKIEEEKKSIEVDDNFIYYTTYKDSDNKTVRKLPMSERGQKIVYNIAKKYGLPYKVVLAILGVETNWNEEATYEINSGVKYIGIGCLNEKYHAANLAKEGIDIYTLEGNIEGICYLLKGHLDRFDGDIIYAIMAYNGGAGYAKNKKADGIRETSYTRKVNWYVESFGN